MTVNKPLKCLQTHVFSLLSIFCANIAVTSMLLQEEEARPILLLLPQRQHGKPQGGNWTMNTSWSASPSNPMIKVGLWKDIFNFTRHNLCNSERAMDLMPGEAICNIKIHKKCHIILPHTPLVLAHMSADIFKIYCADHTYSTLKLRMDTTVEEIIQHASSKLCLGDDLVLCEIKSNGGGELSRYSALTLYQ